eukprot:CAMPEP_0172370888 /NCGR_PEP_ID=MMETSP1060-20121228/40221_1 /TAXON_ID=37318 /ORGANISM="Pseudo-nitzschia pungens, Strain cf. cingulata" /LENGTH=359 /DNA_ID=CAMNT_0013096339 /DNA_START=111 /DNA_END=1187 /DNA_ORIENTATION=-
MSDRKPSSQMQQAQGEREHHFYGSLQKEIPMPSDPSDDVAHSKTEDNQQQEQWEDHPYESLYNDVLLPLIRPGGERAEGGSVVRPKIMVVSLDSQQEEEHTTSSRKATGDSTDPISVLMAVSGEAQKKQHSVLTTRSRSMITGDLNSTRSLTTIATSDKMMKQMNPIHNDDNITQSILQDVAWMNMYQRLVGYKKEHGGSTLVPVDYEKDPALGRWAADQRFLPPSNIERRKLLDIIDFCWDARKGREDAVWADMLRRVVAYKLKNNGSTMIPRNFVDSDGRKLGRWADDQRKRMRMKRLDRDRIYILESIGFVWQPRKVNEDKAWGEMYKRLLSYKLIHHGSTAVPQSYSLDPKLGQW